MRFGLIRLLQASDAEKLLRKEARIAVPFPEPRPGKDAKYTLEFIKPSSINVVGSFALRTSVKSKGPTAIDLAVTMPRVRFGCFE